MRAAHGSGASPWRPSSAARPLQWWSEKDLQSLAGALQGTLTQWRAAWGFTGEDGRVRCQPAGRPPFPDGSCVNLMAGGTAHAWLSMPQDDGEGLLQGLFPAAAVFGPLARSVAYSCRRDALARIAALLGLETGGADAAAPATLGRTGSGAVEADLPPLGARLLIGNDIASRWRQACRGSASAESREPLVEATAALVNKPLALSVDLRGCRIGVGALQGLQVGDVVRLDHSLAHPAGVKYGGALLCAAYLGRRGNRKAVELAGQAAPAIGEVAP